MLWENAPEIANIEKNDKPKDQNEQRGEYIPAKVNDPERWNDEEAVDTEFQKKLQAAYEPEQKTKPKMDAYEKILRENEHLITNYEKICEKHLPNDLRIDLATLRQIIQTWTPEQKQAFIQESINPGLNHIYRNVTGRFVMRWLSSLFASTRVDKGVVALQELYIDIKNNLLA